MTINLPEALEYASYYHTYISKVKEHELLNALEEGYKNFEAFVKTIPADKGDYSYAPGKWTIKELIAHIIDTERVFAYRALRFSRNDKTELPGFDENQWAPESNAAARNITDLINEYKFVRGSTLALFSSLTPEMALRTGIASKNPISVRALGFIIAGHEIHHTQVLKERYL